MHGSFPVPFGPNLSSLLNSFTFTICSRNWRGDLRNGGLKTAGSFSSWFSSELRIFNLIPRKQRFLFHLRWKREEHDCRANQNRRDAGEIRPLIAVEERFLGGGD